MLIAVFVKWDEVLVDLGFRVWGVRLALGFGDLRFRNVGLGCRVSHYFEIDDLGAQDYSCPGQFIAT